MEDLRCEAFIRVLQKCGIVSNRPMQFSYSSDMNEIDRFQQRGNAWEYFTTMIQNNNFLLLGRFFRDADTEGHCVICQGGEEEEVLIVDPQKGVSEFYTKDEFIDYVWGDEGLEVYTIDLEMLRMIVEPHNNVLHRMYQNYGVSSSLNS